MPEAICLALLDILAKIYATARHKCDNLLLYLQTLDTISFPICQLKGAFSVSDRDWRFEKLRKIRNLNKTKLTKNLIIEQIKKQN